MKPTFDWSEAIGLTQQLAHIDTFHTPGKTLLLQKVKKLLNDSTNAQVTIYGEEVQTPYLVAKLEVEKPSFSLLLEGHIDVVSPDGVPHPFAARIDNGIMYGRGVCDMKGGCSAQLLAFIHAAQTPAQQGSLYLVFTSDEEYASEQIITAFEQKHIPKCDFVMIAEPTDRKICTAHKGNAWLDVEFQGKSAHASTPELGNNAIYMASTFIQKLRTHIQGYSQQKHELYGMPTMNVGCIEGGSKPNVVAPSAKICLDKRYLPQDNYENFIAEIKTLIHECQLEDPDFSAQIVEVGDWSPVILDRKNPILLEVQQSITQATGQLCELAMMDAWGEGGYIQKYDIPVIYYGPGSFKYAHTPEEQVDIKDIEAVAQGYYASILTLCFSA